jgi:hypothetical protein
MRLEPLYRLTFRYPESWRAGDETLLIAEGRADGRLSGRFRAANRARRLPAGDFLPHVAGAVETTDGASVLVDLTGNGRPDEGRVVGAALHFTDDERYAWIDRVVCAVVGEVRGGREVVLDVARIVWEPLAEYDSTHEH